MGRPPAESADTKLRAIAAIVEATNLDSLKAAQATLLPLLGLSLEETAAAIGKDRHWTSRARSRFLRGQPPAAAHGGRRRSLVSEDAEVELLRKAIAQDGVTWFARVSVRAAFRELLGAQTPEGAPGESTVSEILSRATAKLFPGLSVAQLSEMSAEIAKKWRVEKVLRQRASESDGS